MINHSSIEVSACIIVFNHDKYLRQCLDSAINQQVDFGYEIVIGEDCSTDGSLEICREYQRTYPHLIRLIERSKNLGMAGNWKSTIEACKGEFIAICEGDDYWCDTLKIKKQYMQMKLNHDLSACFSNCKVLNQRIGSSCFSYKIPPKAILDLQDILNRHYVPTATLFFRSSRLGNIPQYISSVMSVDIFIETMLCMNGPFMYIKEQLAVYRRHNTGVTTNSDATRFGEQKLTEMYIYFYHQTSGRIKFFFRQAISQRYLFRIHQLRRVPYFEGLLSLVKMTGDWFFVVRDNRLWRPLIITTLIQIFPFISFKGSKENK